MIRTVAAGWRASRFIERAMKAANDGVIITWDRTMTEISDKLWFAIDYAGRKSANGALNIAFLVGVREKHVSDLRLRHLQQQEHRRQTDVHHAA